MHAALGSKCLHCSSVTRGFSGGNGHGYTNALWVISGVGGWIGWWWWLGWLLRLLNLMGLLMNL